MDASSELSQQQRLLGKLIFHNELRQMMQFVPTLPTLNFILPDSNETPLLLAVRTAEEEVVEYLLLRGADPNFASPQTLPLLAAIERSIEADKYWADANFEEGGEDPLFLVELLVRYGADFTKADPTGESAADFARATHHPATALFARLRPPDTPAAGE